ncbi:hypothetical protein GCM10010249_33830 [Streptomyces roseolilacinus]|uniref:Uncharacterized protein n=1 Tax=Streptomyces roseolilacinus TaxID=66904 RepID=A0A918EK64_9ACTN|nr:hypothetical protein GCM10010249_33830 [Streptomyces roseolilacinus]
MPVRSHHPMFPAAPRATGHGTLGVSASVGLAGGIMSKGWPERWWSTALVAVALVGVVSYDVWWVAGILAEPVVDWWELLGPGLGGAWFAALAVSTAHRAATLRRNART